MIILMTYYLPVNMIFTSSIKFIFSCLSNRTELVKIKTSYIDRKTKFNRAIFILKIYQVTSIQWFHR